MKVQIFALLAAVGAALAQGVTGQISPKGDSPAGCKPTSDGKFEIAIVELNNPAKRNLALQNRATCSGSGILVAQLAASVLTDDHARTGYIASNYQFQFDAPPQAGALYTAGFSQCANGSLALGSSTVFYQCRSGSFYNLYDRWWADQCEPVEIIIMPCAGGAEQASQPAGGGETVVGTQIVTTTVVAPLGDGQPQVVTTTTAVLICQIGDGQIQGHTTPCSGVPTTQTSASPSIPPVSQYSDGQIQVTPAPAPSGSNGGSSGGVTVTVPFSPSESASETAGGQAPSSTASAPAGGQVTSSASGSVPIEVPTSAPGVSEAAAAAGGGRIPVVMVGLGVAGMVWGW